MMRRLNILVILVCVTLLYNSCRKENLLDCFKPNGPETTETRYPGDFRQVEVFDKVIVKVFKGAEYKVEVVAGKNIIGNVSTKVKDNVLTIRNDNTCNFVRGYKREIKVNVTVPYVEKVTNSGVATVSFADDFAQDTLVVRAQNSGDIYVNGTYNQVRTSSHGNGDIYLSGNCNSFFIYTYGTNYVHAENLNVSDYLFVETITIGKVYVNCNNLTRFEYNIESSGNIYYSGDPLYITDFSNGKSKGRAIRQ